MPMIYATPGTTESSIGTQIRTDSYYKKALVEAGKEIYFGQLADVRSMPKNMGKTIKQFHYLPILDDRNINDQGLDANGLATDYESTITLKGPGSDGTAGDNDNAYYFVGQHASVDATAITAAKTAFLAWVKTNFPASYAAMPHTTVAADYVLQTAVSAIKQIVTHEVETVAENDVYTLTYMDTVLTSTALDATPTIAELLAALIGGANATAYAALPFVLTAVGTTLVATWKLAGAVAQEIVLARTVGTAIAGSQVITTTGAWTIYDLGYRCTLNTSVAGAGNLYGSSKDIGVISARMPTLSETGGRVNRVGMTRIEIEGTFAKFGFFDEYTQESIDFDTDAELEQHITTESVKAATEINEDQIQIDLLNSPGVIRYAGDAVSVDSLSGETGGITVVTYDDLMKLDLELDANRCPKNTKIIAGSRMVDTKVVSAARYMYIGSELQPTLMKMVDYHNEPAFVPVAKYANAGNIARGEIGSIGNWRFIVVPEMMRWAGDGAEENNNAGYHATGGNYDIFPMLVVGDGSFTTIGFQTDGKTVKFKIKHKKPEDSHDRTDPYGETGFYSIKWYYGMMILRPERLAIIKTVAEL